MHRNTDESKTERAELVPRALHGERSAALSALLCLPSPASCPLSLCVEETRSPSLREGLGAQV